jgi:NifB/MoaA-like Fe-S oxidoreductase
MDRPTAALLLDHVTAWSDKARVTRGHAWVYGSDELYLLAGRDLPDADYYADFPQIENGVGSVAYLRKRVGEGLSALPRLDGKRIGVVTGLSMRALMSAILDSLSATTGAEFELIPSENSLFGKTTTVAGLLVGADIRRVQEAPNDLDVVLMPAETINDSGVFLDDTSFAELSAASPVPLIPSYDFIDVLSDAGAGAAWSSR